MSANSRISASFSAPNLELNRVSTSESLSLRAAAARMERSGETITAILFNNEAFRLETTGDPEIKIERRAKVRS